MSAKKLPWFRMYADFLNDPKLISLAFEDQRHFIGVLALKCDGAIDDVADGDLLDRIVAQRLWIDHAVIRDVKRRLIAAGLIDASWQPLAWEKRQMRSDVDATGAERQRRYREAQKRNALRDGAVTRLEEDTDTDKEEEIETVTSFKGRGANLPPDAPPAAAPTPATGSACATPKRKTASSTGTRLPDGWQLPKSWGDWALEERPDMTPADVRREADCFADYWHAVPGAKGRKADWQGTWRNWIRRSDGAVPSLRGGRGVAVQQIDPHAPVETYAQRAARQRVEEVAPMAARKAPGQRCGFERAQAFMNGDVIDVTPAQPRIGG